MVRMTALQDMLGSIIEKGARLIEARVSGDDDQSLADLCDRLISSRGEASGVALASRILGLYQQLDEQGRLSFYHDLADRFDTDADMVTAAAARFSTDNSPETLSELMAVCEAPRQELFRRLNLAPGGTAALVALRKDLLDAMRTAPTLRRIDLDLAHLFGSWFNRGFLMLRPIDWSTPANLLEKIIEYEAVHEIGNWEELRRRLRPTDRRCFGFFHPSMPDEPLIFVEVALTRDIPGSIHSVLREDREEVPAEKATTAVFYSISNCQLGLRGVSFGNFLIKQVARDLTQDLPNLDTFITLSPVPGFAEWIHSQAEDHDDVEAREAMSLMSQPDWQENPEVMSRAETLIPILAAYYLLEGKNRNGRPFDPVARFHLGNGAILDRVNWPGDLSTRGQDTAMGVMVNYRYDLSKVEDNHEAFAIRGEVKAARAVQNLALTKMENP